MQLRHLRATLRGILLAGLPAAALAGCFVDDDPCSEHEVRMIRVAEPPPEHLATAVEACVADPAACIQLCNKLLFETVGYDVATSCEVRHDRTGHDVEVGYEAPTYATGCPVPGRRPAGLGGTGAARAACRQGAWLARAAWFEGASVHAFVALARELAAHGAPPALRRAAQRAAVDEARHAAAMSVLAGRYGGRRVALEVAPPTCRSIEALAVENAAEGCVGETWAAVVAQWQAGHAGDPAVRTALASIAADETRHAALGWATDRWAHSRLGGRAQARVAVARRRAADRLVARVSRATPAPELVSDLGLPDRATARRLVGAARDALWV